MFSNIAISAEIDLFKNERILNREWAKKYPGALWMSILAEKLKKKKFNVTTADVALSHVKQNYWEAKDIGVIQHAEDPDAEELIGLGAIPLVLTIFESPLYVSCFYEKLHDIAPKFYNRVFFKGAFDLFKATSGINHAVRFPSYNNEEIIIAKPWESKNFSVMVVNNKYAINSAFLNIRYPIDCLRWLKRKCFDFSASSFLKKIINLQLQDKRLSAINFFGKKELLELYGTGWDSLINLPKTWQYQLSSVIDKLKPGYFYWHEKKEKISHYKFALCFENFSFPGYITEKIIDCFVASVIPVYLGAPDIEEFIPSDSFIDVRKYKSWDGVLAKLMSLTEMEATKMINSGRKFLASSEGQLYSFEGFASFVEGLILQACDSVSDVDQEK